MSDAEIERLVNDCTAKGYGFASIHFVTTQASRRPVMAFLFFTGPGDEKSPDASDRTGV